MKWYWKNEGIHVKVRVFMNGALCGSLCFRADEFSELKAWYNHDITFINENDEEQHEAFAQELKQTDSGHQPG